MKTIHWIAAVAMTGCGLDASTPEEPAVDNLVAHARTRVTDELEHVRFHQTYRGVRVLHGSVMESQVHGIVTNRLDRTMTDLDLDVVPAFSEDEAKARAIADLGRPMVARAELVIDTEFKRENAHRIPVRHVLAWQVVLGNEREMLVYNYDAKSGELRDKHEAGSADTNTRVFASTEYYGAHSVNVVKGDTDCGAFRLEDWERGHSVFMNDDLFGTIYADGDGHFGDADAPTRDYTGMNGCAVSNNANAQTAAVDAESSLAVVWDMYANVFNTRGWDGDSSGVDLFVHDQVDNSHYQASFQPFHGPYIKLGDGDWQHGGTPLTTVDLVGHEFTHGVDNHLGSLPDTSSGNELSEGIADIGGVLARLYLHSGGWANGTKHVVDTNNENDFELFGDVLASPGKPHKQRFLRRPSIDGSPDFFYDSIDDLDPHQAGGPIRRAFYFIMKGADAHDDWDTHEAWNSSTTALPWGLKGLGVDKGSQIFFHTFFGCLDDADYEQAEICAQVIATELFGIDAALTVRNAFAGIGVGSLFGYPAAPPTFDEKEKNENASEATEGATWRAAPDGFQNVFKMNLRGSLSSTSDIDEFKFKARCGRHLGALLEPTSLFGRAMSVQLWFHRPGTSTWVAFDPATKAGDFTASGDATGWCTGTDEQEFIVKVQSSGGSGSYVVHMTAE